MVTIPGHDLGEIDDTSELMGSGRSTSYEEKLSQRHTLARIRLLWDRRDFLARMALCGLLCATLIAFLIPKRYESTTRLMPPDDQSNNGMALIAAMSGKMAGGLGALAGDALGLKSSGALFVGILGSRTVQDGLINKFDLRNVYSHRSWKDTRRILTSNTDISEDRKSGIITITVTDRDPRRAAGMAEEYVAQLNSVVSQLSTSSAHRERVFLEGRLAQVKQDLEKAERDFSQFASQNATIDIKEQGKAMVGAAAMLQGQLVAVESELEGLKQIYTDSNVRVRALRARITELRSQLEQLGGGDIANSSNPQRSSPYPSIRQLPLLGVPYADLYRGTQIQEAVFQTLTQEYELAKVREAKEIPSVKELDSAEVPQEKSFPPRLLIMVLGMAFFFVCGVVWVGAQARWSEMDARNPKKEFAQEVFNSLRRPFTDASDSGRISSALTQFKERFRRHQDRQHLPD